MLVDFENKKKKPKKVKFSLTLDFNTITLLCGGFFILTVALIMAIQYFLPSKSGALITMPITEIEDEQTTNYGLVENDEETNNIFFQELFLDGLEHKVESKGKRNTQRVRQKKAPWRVRPLEVHARDQRKSLPIKIPVTTKFKVKLAYGIDNIGTELVYAYIVSPSRKLSHFKGATVIGRMNRNNTVNRLNLVFAKIKLSDGKEIPITAHALGLDNNVGVIGKVTNNTPSNILNSVAQTAINSASTALSGPLLDSIPLDGESSVPQHIVSIAEGTEFYLFFDEDVRF